MGIVIKVDPVERDNERPVIYVCTRGIRWKGQGIRDEERIARAFESIYMGRGRKMNSDKDGRVRRYQNSR